ncbi:nitrate- and nitrite sensing domain-containing protein [Streptomyces sp. NPDC098789]|uniref:sensor histidine kinase n=1 Tax=Streptomyces sp. NPDC098789 TaxID=3366098 RepID=UPI0037F50EE5
MSTYALHHRRLGTQVGLVLLLPLCLALGLAVTVVRDAAEHHHDTVVTERRAFVALAATAVTRGLENERGALALAGGKVTDQVEQRRRETDRAVEKFHEDAGPGAADTALAPRLARARTALDGLDRARAADLTRPGDLPDAVSAYHDAIEALGALAFAPGPGPGPDSADGTAARATDTARAVRALAAGTAALSAQRALIDAAPDTTALSGKDTAFLARQDGQRRYAAREFRAAADARSAPGQDATAIDNGCLAAPLARAAEGKRPARAEWGGCATRVLDRMHEVSSSLQEQSLHAASTARARAWEALLAHVALVACAVLVSAGVAAFVARRLVRRLQRLRRAALKAQHELPALVARVSRAPDPGGLALDVTPVDLGATDEVGDVTRAFDAVVREAVTQTCRQVVLRAVVHERLAAMSLRSHVLVHEQLDLLGRLQMAEGDPDALDSFFRLDHLANRMRRHGENMLLLTGAAPGRGHPRPEPLIDVLRAAASEVDEYTRAAVRQPVPAVTVPAEAVSTLTHLLAEVIDNAIRFSPPDRPVEVSAELLPGQQLVVRVRDEGSGIPRERLDALNVLLQGAPSADWMESEQIGLHVIGRLAAHLGARVCLDSSWRGTTVVVHLPAGRPATAPTERPLE